jgi:cell pole-organizing protein PopZ
MANNAAAFQPGQQPGSEPSMEEILASIRRIIADDSIGKKKDNTPAAVPPPPPPAPEPVAIEPDEDLDADVLDLAGVATLAGEPHEDEVMIGEAEDAMAEPQEFAGRPGPVRAMVMPPPAPVPLATPAAMEGHILGRETSGLVANAFAQLSRNTPMPAPGRTLEDLVAEMLRPLLREWMDSHLPAIVERLVKAEIERAARGG